MPPEWAPHSATWMGFPNDAYPGAGVSKDEVQQAWADVANAIAEHEPVHMLCNPDDLGRAQKRLSAAVTLHPQALDDAWLRDIGPTFVVDGESLRAVDWRFNGWGDNGGFDWRQDAQVGGAVAELAGCAIDTSALTHEGGGLHVNGEGLVILTDTVQLDPDRNPGWSREQVEAEVHTQLGTQRALWLPRGLYRDYLSHGTRGHVDMVACFVPDGSLLLHHQTDDSHPDAQLYAPLREALEPSGVTIHPLPAPRTLKDNIDWVDYSYINHYVLNGAVIMPTFRDPADQPAAELLAALYPGREILNVDARVVFAMGGGVHCITQQQPSV